MKKIKLFLLATLFCCAVFRVAASPVILDDHTWSFLQIGIVPDAVALVPSDIPVLGINAEFFCGMQQRVGIINFQPVVGITDVLKGVSFQGFGFNGETEGVALGVSTFHDWFCGFNLAAVTAARENHGFQVGVVNLSGKCAPAQKGDTPEPPAALGVQLGLVNCTTNGFQIGLLNYNADSVIPVMILFNFSIAK